MGTVDTYIPKISFCKLWANLMPKSQLCLISLRRLPGLAEILGPCFYRLLIGKATGSSVYLSSHTQHSSLIRSTCCKGLLSLPPWDATSPCSCQVSWFGRRDVAHLLECLSSTQEAPGWSQQYLITRGGGHSWHPPQKRKGILIWSLKLVFLILTHFNKSGSTYLASDFTLSVTT